ncbi:uncharacterized protein LOC142325735 [Lycorma delicatula]|uniref:uncharacterized protein LOC142325735 n=1 Tax=Lycorma delicatula TaxID=130591 RepID=UPI003F51282A
MAVYNPIAELRFQAQWKEMERKNQKIKMKWFEKNYERVYLNPSLPLDKVPKRATKLYEELVKQRQERFEVERKERREYQKSTPLPPLLEEDKIGIDVDDLLKKGPMYPVPDDVKVKLYKGTSHNDEGRIHYLRIRNKLPPEEKFYQPVTTTQLLGWKIQERSSPFIRYGKRAVVQQSFTRRNGALKFDSDYWRQPYSSVVTR